MRKICGLISLLLLSLVSSASVYAASGKSKSDSHSYFGFGPGYFSNMNTRSLSADVATGVFWSLDPVFDLAATVNFGFSMEHNDVRFVSPQLKGRYMFSELPFTWYAGGGMGFGYGAAHDGDSAKGFSLSLAIGYRAYRQARMQLSFEFEHQMILKESASGTPLLTSFKVGVHF